MPRRRTTLRDLLWLTACVCCWLAGYTWVYPDLERERVKSAAYERAFREADRRLGQWLQWRDSGFNPKLGPPSD